MRASPYATLITGWRVTAAAPHGRTALVTVQDGDGRERIVVADYVLGCDGARSVIRDAIGARFDGSDDGRRNVNVTFRAPRLAAEVPHGNAVQYWVLNPRQPGLMGLLDLDGVRWCIANGVTPETGQAHAANIVRAMTGFRNAGRRARHRRLERAHAAGRPVRTRAHVHRRGRRAPESAVRRARLQHRHRGRGQYRVEARRRAPRLGTSARAGRRLPHRWACPADSLYDHLGPGFTLIRCDARGPDDGGLIAAAARAGLPLTVLDLACRAGRSTSAPGSCSSARIST